jgi:nicotinamidase-related amidase
MDDASPPQALLVIDMQEDYFADDELRRRRDALVSACNAVVATAHRAGALVLEIRTVHTPDGSSWSLNMLDDGVGMTIQSTPGAQPVDGLASSPAVVVEKTRDSAFHGTALAEKLGDRGIESIAICGVSTESCIAMTAAEAYARDLHVTLVSDALASVDPEAHDHALDRLTRQYRQTITTSDAIRFAAVVDELSD